MDKDKLVKKLMEPYLEELDEHVKALNRDLLALEKNPTSEEQAERFKTLFRTAHSLKGASRSVNIGLVESVCHELEEILAWAQKGIVTLGPDQFALLYKTADGIEEAGKRLREQQDLSGAPLAAILHRLRAATDRPPAAAPTPAAQKVEARTSKGEERRAKGEGQETDTPLAPAQPPVVDVQPSSLDPQQPLAAEPALETLSGPATVRVTAEKLDSLLAQSGELLVARRRIQSRAEDAVAIKEFVSRWRESWRIVEKGLGRFLRDGEKTNGEVTREAPDGVKLLSRRAAQTLRQAGDDFRQLEKELDRLAASMSGDGRLLKQAAGALDDEIRRVRMLPFAEACQGLDRMVRDLARSGGKEVDLVIEGGDVELDRSVLASLQDPLRHLVRNAVDHGVEPAPERLAAGRSPRGQVRVAAVLRGAHVEVVVADDGRGIDLEALRQQVKKRKLPEPADERELVRLIFLPGFSTSRIITGISGRGIGLEVVKSRVESLHGTVELSFTPGKGTLFTLAVPLTLTTLRALLVRAGGQTFALAGTNVQKLALVDPGKLRSVEGREMCSHEGTPLPVASLAETLGLGGREPARTDGRVALLIVADGEKRMAFAVEEFLAEQEIMIKPLGARIRRVRHASAATILPSGRIALVLNVAGLIRTALGQRPGQSLAAAQAKMAPEARKRILVAEDSMTTRTLMKTILEAAGYEVEVAVDGAAAWQLLQERGANLVVSDVDMPRMDGFALTEAVRGSKRFQDLPVVLVTARETEKDKMRGIEVKADAYLVKSGFDQKNLLQAIAQLL